MQIPLTSKFVSASSLQCIFKVFYRINVSCLTEIKYTTKKTELLIGFSFIEQQQAS